MYALKSNGLVVATQESPIEYIPDQYAWQTEDSLICDTLKVMTVEQAPEAPASVSMLQAELELLDADLLNDVEALVATLPRAHQIAWKRASTVERNHPLVEIVRQQKGLTSEDIDQLFIRAATR